MPYPYHRAFAFVIGLGMLLMGIGLAVAGALGDHASESVVGVFVVVGAVLAVGGTALWAVVERPVEDPYEQPPPEFEHGHAEH